MARASNGLFYVEHVVRGQWSALERNRIIEQTAERDAHKYGGTVTIYVEQEGAGAGKETTDQLILQLCQFPVYRDLASVSAGAVKVERWYYPARGCKDPPSDAICCPV